MQKVLICSVALLLAACTPHQLEIQQGNLLSREKLDLLKPGMEAKQVRFVLGSPLLQDPFHPERWDYYYSLKQDGELETRYRVSLYFEDGRYQRMEDTGAVPATEREAIKKVAGE